MSLTFAEYAEVANSTAIYPNRGSNLHYPMYGLGGEKGEIDEKLKKLMRDKGLDITRGRDLPQEVRDDLEKELGDILWYLQAVAFELGTDLERVARRNNEKLLSRQQRDKLHGSGDDR